MTLTFRPLRLRDALFCWRLASDPVVREASVDRRRPTVLGHLAWMWRWTIGSGTAWAIMSNGVRVGLFRGIEIGGGRSEVSIALTAEARGQGIGTEAIRHLSFDAAVCCGFPVLARVRSGNVASIRAFHRAGYEVESTSDEWVWLTWSPPPHLRWLKEMALCPT